MGRVEASLSVLERVWASCSELWRVGARLSVLERVWASWSEVWRVSECGRVKANLGESEQVWASTHTHTQTQHKHSHTHTHSRTNPHTHTHTHTHIHLHTHTAVARDAQAAANAVAAAAADLSPQHSQANIQHLPDMTPAARSDTHNASQERERSTLCYMPTPDITAQAPVKRIGAHENSMRTWLSTVLSLPNAETDADSRREYERAQSRHPYQGLHTQAREHRAPRLDSATACAYISESQAASNVRAAAQDDSDVLITGSTFYDVRPPKVPTPAARGGEGGAGVVYVKPRIPKKRNRDTVNTSMAGDFASYYSSCGLDGQLGAHQVHRAQQPQATAPRLQADHSWITPNAQFTSSSQSFYVDPVNAGNAALVCGGTDSYHSAGYSTNWQGRARGETFESRHDDPLSQLSQDDPLSLLANMALMGSSASDVSHGRQRAAHGSEPERQCSDVGGFRLDVRPAQRAQHYKVESSHQSQAYSKLTYNQGTQRQTQLQCHSQLLHMPQLLPHHQQQTQIQTELRPQQQQGQRGGGGSGRCAPLTHWAGCLADVVPKHRRPPDFVQNQVPNQVLNQVPDHLILNQVPDQVSHCSSIMHPHGTHRASHGTHRASHAVGHAMQSNAGVYQHPQAYAQMGALMSVGSAEDRQHTIGAHTTSQHGGNYERSYQNPSNQHTSSQQQISGLQPPSLPPATNLLTEARAEDDKTALQTHIKNTVKDLVRTLCNEEFRMHVSTGSSNASVKQHLKSVAMKAQQDLFEHVTKAKPGNEAGGAHLAHLHGFRLRELIPERAFQAIQQATMALAPQFHWLSSTPRAANAKSHLT